jgi:5'-3' exonuclease
MMRKPLQCETGGTRLLVDGDILLYRIGFTTQEETEEIAIVRMNNYIDEILFNSGCSDYTVYLTDSKGNFRNKLYPQYKANRTADKPKHYPLLKEYLINHEYAEVAWGQEADDALGINQTETTIIASIDKDLLMIPGRHYNFVKNQHINISYEEGIKRFYMQLLTGDSTDNIPGLPKVGPKTAEKILNGCDDEECYKEKVLEAYKSKYSDLDDAAILERVNLIGKLLWIRRKEDEDWSF